MRRSRVILRGLAIALVFPAVASAGDVSVPNGSTTEQGDWLGVFRGRAGETNVLTMRERGAGTMEFTDTGAPITGQPLVDSAGCSPLGAGVPGILCEPVRHVDAYLGNRNDQARFTMSTGRAVIWTGPGDDFVRADSFGAYARAYGQGGNDDLAAGGEGGQLVDGGPGGDRLYVGGFAGDATGLGGPGQDRMTFAIGLPTTGTGHLEGGSGDDHISLQSPGFAIAHGNNGADVIDVLAIGGYGRFTISGDAGPDTLSGGPDADVLDGGKGADSIDATAGGIDSITCGTGHDIVRADTTDSVAADCEQVRLEPGSVA